MAAFSFRLNVGPTGLMSAVLLFLAAGAAMASPQAAGATTQDHSAITGTEASPAVRGARATLSGVRATQGDAVDCPRIRDDAGRLHPVSYLSPAVAIGDRVTVSGVYAVTTRCRGLVLAVERELRHAP